MRAVEWVFGRFRSLGPYLAIELILPGGTLVALLLWTYRHRFAARQTVVRFAYAAWACFTVALLAVGWANMQGGGASVREADFETTGERGRPNEA